MTDYEMTQAKKLMHNERIQEIRRLMLKDRFSDEFFEKQRIAYESGDEFNRYIEFVAESWNNSIVETINGNFFPSSKIDRFYTAWLIIKDRC